MRPQVDLTPDELDKLQRRLLVKALAVILSPEWDNTSESDEAGDSDD